MLIPPTPLEPDEVIGGCIAVYKNAWPNISATVSLFEKIVQLDNQHLVETERFFQKATVIADADTSIDLSERTSLSSERTNSHMNLSHGGTRNEQIRLVNNNFSDLIVRTVNPYAQRFAINETIIEKESLVVLRYQLGEEYKAHYDGDTGSKRVLSPILYLNDDYEGGEIEFVNFGIKLKPEAGTFLLFPASYPYRHIAHPVTKGTKYAMVTWLHDRN